MWVSHYPDGRFYTQSSDSSYGFFIANTGAITLPPVSEVGIADDAQWHQMDDIPDSVQHRLECILNAC